MKKLLIASIAATVVATPAAAQEVEMALTGEVATICGAFDFQANPVPIDFGALSDVEVGSQTTEKTNGVTIVCNDPDGGVVTVASTNGGNLWRTGTSGGANNQVGYTVRATGGSGLAFTSTTLATPVLLPFNSSSAYLNGQSMTLRFAANGVGQDAPAGNDAPSTTVYAGTYTDLVTVSVTAN